MGGFVVLKNSIQEKKILKHNSIKIYYNFIKIILHSVKKKHKAVSDNIEIKKENKCTLLSTFY